jgi:transposase-like protein
MPDSHNKIIDEVMEQLIAQGPGGMATVFTSLFNLAMRFERENFLGARHYERNDERRGYANGVKSKRIDTPAGTLTLDVPKTADTDEPFYPQSLERGTRTSRALMLAVAEMYVKGVSTRDVADVLDKFGIDGLSSTQVSRASKLLDHDLEQWRNRPLGEVCYLILDARYEKVRIDGVVRDATILSALGVGPDCRRSILGVSVALSEAEVHWRAFLDSLIRRGLRGVQFITSDDHAGLAAARRAVFGGVTWQRCQFHLAQNAIHHAPSHAIRSAIGAELRAVWNARTLSTANEELRLLVQRYSKTAPDLSRWLERNIPEGLAVFSLPDANRLKMRTSNPIERAVQQELKRRTIKVRVFPSIDALLRLVSAVLVEIDDQWAASTQPYIKWNPNPASTQ